MEASISIFDAVGSKVIDGELNSSGKSLVGELHHDPRTRVIFYWNGQNSSGRRVGRGAYLAIVTVTDANGQAVREKITIGVK